MPWSSSQAHLHAFRLAQAHPVGRVEQQPTRVNRLSERAAHQSVVGHRSGGCERCVYSTSRQQVGPKPGSTGRGGAADRGRAAGGAGWAAPLLRAAVQSRAGHSHAARARAGTAARAATRTQRSGPAATRIRSRGAAQNGTSSGFPRRTTHSALISIRFEALHPAIRQSKQLHHGAQTGVTGNVVQVAYRKQPLNRQGLVALQHRKTRLSQVRIGKHLIVCFAFQPDGFIEETLSLFKMTEPKRRKAALVEISSSLTGVFP